MAQFSHKVPRELRNEDRWFKIFSPKQAIAAAICAAVAIPVGIFIHRLFGNIPTIIVLEFYIIFCAVGMFTVIPNSQYMLGGGQSAAMVVVRCVVRRLTKKVYVKHMDEGRDLG